MLGIFSVQDVHLIHTMKPNRDHSLPRVVILGAGFAGLQAAQHLKNTPVHLTLIDRQNFHLFQPLLYQVATAVLPPAQIAVSIRSVLRHQQATDVVLDEVVGVDTTKKQVLLSGVTAQRVVPYDFLVVATGASHSYFGKDQWAENAPGLKSISDAIQIREKILLAFEKAEAETDEEKRRALLTFVIVGAGPTGVELAGAIAELSRSALASGFHHINPGSSRILLLEAGPRILAAFPNDLAEKAIHHLKRLGVDVQVSSPAQNIDSGGVVIHGTRIESSTIVWAAGVQASPAAQWLSAEQDRAGRVHVTPQLRLPGHPEIFVIGDTAAVSQDGKPLPGLAAVAMQEGRYVASLIKHQLKAGTRTEKQERPFRYRNKGNIAVIGRRSAIVELGRIHLNGVLAWFLWAAVHLYYLIGFHNRLIVLLEWAWSYLTYQRGARIIFSVPKPVAEAKKKEDTRLAA